MAITAKKNFTLKKKDLLTSKSTAVGFRKTVAYHKAEAGDTSINLTDLTMPTEMSSVGYTNPSTQTLMAADLTFYKDNLALVSSARGYLQPGLSYNVSSNTNIVFSDSFGTALADEIFTIIIDPVAKSGVEFVDGVALPVTGVLPAGQQDFNIGVPFEVNKFPTTQMGVYQIFYDGVLQSRNVGNADADPSADGNYQELAGTGGLASLIRFNDIDEDDEHDIKCIPVGMMIERPSGSMRAELERQQGQINKIVEVLSDVSGSPESTFTAAPSDVDLKTFGDRVLGLETNLLEDPTDASQGPRIATTSVAGVLKRNKYQLKSLATTLSASQDPVTDLTFNNLVPGKTYRLTFSMIYRITGSSGTEVGELQAEHNGTVLASMRSRKDTLGNTSEGSGGATVVFLATATTITFDFNLTGTGSLLGDNATPRATFAILEELNNYDVTTEWT